MRRCGRESVGRGGYWRSLCRRAASSAQTLILVHDFEQMSSSPQAGRSLSFILHMTAVKVGKTLTQHRVHRIYTRPAVSCTVHRAGNPPLFPLPAGGPPTVRGGPPPLFQAARLRAAVARASIRRQGLPHRSPLTTRGSGRAGLVRRRTSARFLRNALRQYNANAAFQAQRATRIALRAFSWPSTLGR
jgi:hypothetical protein